MTSYIFKITNPGDILKAENRFLDMFNSIQVDYQNNLLNKNTIDIVINYGQLVIKQMRSFVLKRIYERKADNITALIDVLKNLKGQNENNND